MRKPPAGWWIVVWTLALATRIAASFFLPNAELDGYSYAVIIADYTAKMQAGHFHFADLYGFWLPLFQVVSTLVNLLLHDPLLSAKLVSGFCGALSCVLVFYLTEELTGDWRFASLCFGLILVSPLHLLYSAAAMTDVPFGCLLLACTWCVLRERWLGAAIFLALSGMVRLESWALIPILPVLEIWRRRKFPWATCLIVVFPVIFWLSVAWLAKGDAFAYFADRVVYHAHYMDFHATRHWFAFADIEEDVRHFVMGTNHIVLLVAFVAAPILTWRLARRGDAAWWKPFVLEVLLCGLLGLFVLGYVTKRQPVILPRYGLSFFALGLPLLGWSLQRMWRPIKSNGVAGAGTVGVAGLALFLAMQKQLPTVAKVRDDFRAQSTIARALVAEMRETNANCFADNPATMALSRLPSDRFRSSKSVPDSASKDRQSFVAWLRSENVSHLVFLRTEASVPVDVLPELGQSKDTGGPKFEFVTMETSAFCPSIWLYRVKN